MTIEQTTQSAQIGDYNAAEVARYLGLNPNNPADQAMVAVCRRYDLDPVLKHVIVIPKGGVYVTRDGLLHIAHRSGQLDGIVVEKDPVIVDGEWVAKVSVYRKDMGHPFTYPGRYAVNGGNKQYAQEMALKAAEAHALRRAFAVTGIPAFDEQRPEAPVQPAGQRPSAAERIREALAAPKTGDAEGSQAETSVAEGAAGSSPAGNPSASSEPVGVTAAQIKKMGAAMRDAGLNDRDAALAYVAAIIGRNVSSRNDLSKDEASRVIDALERGEAAPPATAGDVVDAELVGDSPDADELWNQIIAAGQEQGIDVADDFSKRMGGLIPDDATGDDLRRYLAILSEGAAA